MFPPCQRASMKMTIIPIMTIQSSLSMVITLDDKTCNTIINKNKAQHKKSTIFINSNNLYNCNIKTCANILITITFQFLTLKPQETTQEENTKESNR